MLATPHGAMDAAMAAGAATAGAYWTQGFADALFVPLSATVFSDYGVSATRTGVILAVSQLSSLLLTAPASVLADAYDCHRSTYIAARVLYAFAAGCMPLLLWLYASGPLAHVGPACWAALLLVVMTLQGTFKSQAMALLDANVLAVLEPLGLRTHYGRVRLFTSLGRATGAVCGGPIYAELGGELFGGRLAATAWFAGSVVLALLGPFQHFALGSKCAKPAAVEDAEAPLLAPVADSGNVDSDDDGGADADVDVSRRRERVPSIADPVEAAAAVAELISRPVVLDDDDGADVMVTAPAPDEPTDGDSDGGGGGGGGDGLPGPPARSPLVTLMREPKLAFLFTLAAVNGIAGATFDYYVVAYARQKLGADGWVCGLITSAATVGNVPGFFFAPMMVRWLGPKWMISTSMAIAVTRCVFYTQLTRATVFLVVPISLLHGVQFSMFWSGGMELAVALSNARVAGTVQALFQGAYFGIGATLGLALGGYLYEARGPVFMFQVKAAVLVAALCVLGLTEWLRLAFARRGRASPPPPPLQSARNQVV